MNPDVYQLALAGAAGLAAGMVFFAGLYATTRMIATVKHPGAFAIASFVGRTAVAVVAAWFAARLAGPVGALAYLAAFTVVRVALVMRVRRQGNSEAA